MKRVILTGSILAVIGLMVALTIPALAHDSGSGNTTCNSDAAWEDMYNACQNGDWEAMEEAAGQIHDEDYGNMPNHEDNSSTTDGNGETSTEGWSEMGSNVGSGMMGGGLSGTIGEGMMGW